MSFVFDPNNKQHIQYVLNVAQKAFRARGIQPSPTMLHRVKLNVLKHLRSYDPQRSSFETFINTMTLPVIRDIEKISHPLPSSGHYQKLFHDLDAAEHEFRTLYLRDPSDEELASMTGLSVRRIEKLRSLRRRRMPMSVLESDDDTDQVQTTADNMVVYERSEYDDWADAVYAGLSDIDKIIMKHGFGYKTDEVLDNNTLAARVNLSPAAVSERKRRILKQLQAFDAPIQK